MSVFRCALFSLPNHCAAQSRFIITSSISISCGVNITHTAVFVHSQAMITLPHTLYGIVYGISGIYSVPEFSFYFMYHSLIHIYSLYLSFKFYFICTFSLFFSCIKLHYVCTSILLPYIVSFILIRLFYTEITRRHPTHHIGFNRQRVKVGF